MNGLYLYCWTNVFFDEKRLLIRTSTRHKVIKWHVASSSKKKYQSVRPKSLKFKRLLDIGIYDFGPGPGRKLRWPRSGAGAIFNFRGRGRGGRPRPRAGAPVIPWRAGRDQAQARDRPSRDQNLFTETETKSANQDRDRDWRDWDFYKISYFLSFLTEFFKDILQEEKKSQKFALTLNFGAIRGGSRKNFGGGQKNFVCPVCGQPNRVSVNPQRSERTKTKDDHFFSWIAGAGCVMVD